MEHEGQLGDVLDGRNCATSQMASIWAGTSHFPPLSLCDPTPGNPAAAREESIQRAAGSLRKRTLCPTRGQGPPEMPAPNVGALPLNPE